MKNVLMISTAGEDLLSNIEASGNSLVINGTEIPSSQWIGTGTYTTTVNGHQISITKASDNSYNLMLEKTADYTYAFTVLDTETEFNVSDQEKLDGIGTIAGAINGSTTIANKSIAGDDTQTNLGSFTLTKGVWIVKIFLRWNQNTNGNRYMLISTTADGSPISVWNQMKVPASPTNYTYQELITFLRPASEQTTYYINVSQNSGNAISVATRWGAIKVG